MTRDRRAQLPQIYTFGFCNFGRKPGQVQKVRATMQRIRSAFEELGHPGVLFTAEIDEGDRTKPDDHTLLRQIFGWRKPLRTRWRRAHMRYRVPVLALGMRFRQPKATPTADGVPRWSPPRQVVEALAGPTGARRPTLAVLGGHYPAGSRNGTRPRAAKVLLDAGYDVMLAVHRRRIAYHHDRGRHVVWGMDCNNRRMPRMHPDEVQLVHNNPDYLRAIPAPGYRAVLRHREKVHNSIEGFHAGLLVVVEFVKKG